MELNDETYVEANNRPINRKQVLYQQLPVEEKNSVKQLVYILDKFQISLGNEN